MESVQEGESDGESGSSSSSGSSQSSSSDVNDVDLDHLDSDEEDGKSASTYAKFKTLNEIDPGELEKHGPKFEQVQLDEVDTTEEFGTVVQYISDGPHGLLLVMPSSQDLIFDLDNVACLPDLPGEPNVSKLVLGFTSDVVGPISMPLYAVSIYEQCHKHLLSVDADLDMRNFFKGRQVCLVKKRLKVINEQMPELLRKKGCDASNAHDEEQTDDVWFSDDEKEKENKHRKKNTHKRQQARGNGDGDELEEGEIRPSQKIQNRNDQGQDYSSNKRGGRYSHD